MPFLQRFTKARYIRGRVPPIRYILQSSGRTYDRRFTQLYGRETMNTISGRGSLTKRWIETVYSSVGDAYPNGVQQRWSLIVDS
jgi:hypothetical protein